MGVSLELDLFKLITEYYRSLNPINPTRAGLFQSFPWRGGGIMAPLQILATDHTSAAKICMSFAVTFHVNFKNA